MNILPRSLFQTLLKQVGKNKVIVLTGPRRVGKTFLLDQLEATLKTPAVRMNGDLPETHQILSSKNIQSYKRLLGTSRLLIIDEAQMIDGIGQILKIIIDHFKDLTILATGSSSFDLTNQIGEPLTGRQLHYHLYPVWQGELNLSETHLDTVRNLEERLLFGSYPELINLETEAEKRKYLHELVASCLFKDILIYDQIRNSNKLSELLQLIAFQVGKEVSLLEIGRQLSISKDTVAKYLDLLSKVFVIYRVGGYSSNLRKEVVKTSKWYFVDNGIRNALINNFSPLAGRNDLGALWENYLMAERIKRNAYSENNVIPYFWRTYDQQEIDLIEVKDGKLSAFEFKWRDSKAKPPVFFTKSYPSASFQVVNRENYFDFID